MGLIKAIAGAVGGGLADQWKEFFYCEAMDKDTMMVKGEKRIGNRSSNTKANDNIISNGSGIVVADGQCMIIVEQGEIVEVCAEPGEFTYDTSSEPSVFTGNLGDSVKKTFRTIGRRITFGGDTGKDQRVYYFNTKELVDNKFGTQNPVPFRVVDKNIGLDIDISLRCNGVYSYKILDPLLFYKNVTGNVENSYSREEIDGQLKGEFLNALQPAFAKISELGIRYSAIPGHTTELAEALNEVLTAKWTELRGLGIVSVGINSITASQEDEDLIKSLQRGAVFRDPTMAAAGIVGAQTEAMKAAASNEGGAMMGFMGLGMAQQAGGMQAQNLYTMGQQGGQAPPPQGGTPAGGAVGGAAAPESWTCECGTVNTGNFCTNCAKPRPLVAGAWVCECGTSNTGNFCSECGKPKPVYRCDKCGWEPPDPTNLPKFCPECGDVFDEADKK